jgi:hypothetical protein
VYPSVQGAASSPFIHPGHELTIVLNAEEAAASGGFRTDPGGNEIAITFRSLFGDPIALPPLRAEALSEQALRFSFPDTRESMGRLLAGPVEIAVRSGDRVTAVIAASDLVALPPSNDITALLQGEETAMPALAAVGADGDVWVPARFGGEPMPMPGCEGNFVMPEPVEVAGAAVLGGALFPLEPLGRLRRLYGYIGDMEINGVSFYGMLYPQLIRPVHVFGTLGVSVCRLNDASDLVIRVQGNRFWANSAVSPFRSVLRDSQPLPLRLFRAPLLPAAETGLWPSPSFPPTDSFGNECPTPGH